MKEFRLPDGTYTNDKDLFNTEWSKLNTPLEAIGFRMAELKRFLRENPECLKPKPKFDRA